MDLVYVLMENIENDFVDGNWTVDCRPIRVFRSSQKAWEYSQDLLEKDYERVRARYGENDVIYRPNMISYNQGSEQIYYSVEPLFLNEEN